MSPNCSDHAVEASVKTVVVPLFSIATTLTGVFIRSCQSVPADLLNAWCGASPRAALLSQHQHCFGCALVVAGLALAALSLMLNPRAFKLMQVISR